MTDHRKKESVNGYFRSARGRLDLRLGFVGREDSLEEDAHAGSSSTVLASASSQDRIKVVAISYDRMKVEVVSLALLFSLLVASGLSLPTLLPFITFSQIKTDLSYPRHPPHLPSPYLSLLHHSCPPSLFPRSCPPPQRLSFETHPLHSTATGLHPHLLRTSHFFHRLPRRLEWSQPNRGRQQVVLVEHRRCGRRRRDRRAEGGSVGRALD